MGLTELYPWLKALHVAAALAFVGGVLSVSLALACLPADSAVSGEVARGLRRWDRAVTTPGMLAAWAFGLTLASQGHWFEAGWLHAKLAFVLVLSGLHGVQSGRLRRLSGSGSSRSGRMAPYVLGCAVVIVILACAKPF